MMKSEFIRFETNILVLMTGIVEYCDESDIQEYCEVNVNNELFY